MAPEKPSERIDAMDAWHSPEEFLRDGKFIR